jgi:hypothetical protein
MSLTIWMLAPWNFGPGTLICGFGSTVTKGARSNALFCCNAVTCFCNATTCALSVVNCARGFSERGINKEQKKKSTDHKMGNRPVQGLYNLNRWETALITLQRSDSCR